MKLKRKSPKALREAKKRKREYGLFTLGTNDFTVAGSLIFGQGLTTASPSITFSLDYDTGISKGDWITISGQSDDRSNRINHRKVHVARRRQSKGKIKPTVYEITNASATVLTIKAGNGLSAGGTITTCA